MKVTEKSAGGLVGTFETDPTKNHGQGIITGNISDAVEHVKMQRELGRNPNSHYQHMAEIPHVIVLELLEKHHLDITSADFLKEPANVKKLKYVLQTEYPELLTMT